jgi:hypothetical protein
LSGDRQQRPVVAPGRNLRRHEFTARSKALSISLAGKFSSCVEPGEATERPMSTESHRPVKHSGLESLKARRRTDGLTGHTPIESTVYAHTSKKLDCPFSVSFSSSCLQNYYIHTRFMHFFITN